MSVLDRDHALAEVHAWKAFRPVRWLILVGATSFIAVFTGVAGYVTAVKVLAGVMW